MKSWFKIIFVLTLVAVSLPFLFYFYNGYHGNRTNSNLNLSQEDMVMKQVFIKGRHYRHSRKNKQRDAPGRRLKNNHLDVLNVKDNRQFRQNGFADGEDHNKQMQKNLHGRQGQLDGMKLPSVVNSSEMFSPNYKKIGVKAKGAIDVPVLSAIRDKFISKNDRASRDVKKPPSNHKLRRKSSLKDDTGKVSSPKLPRLPSWSFNASKRWRLPGGESKTRSLSPLKMFANEQLKLKEYLDATGKDLKSFDAVQRSFLLSKPCSDVLCTEFLLERDMMNFTTCTQRARNRLESLKHNMTIFNAIKADPLHNLLTSRQCRFMNGTGRDLIGLVSFPGSGNTWVRGLLQKATGICTGAVYCDQMLRLSGFDGESVQSSSTLAIKSHWSLPLWTSVRGQYELSSKGRPKFDSVIFIFRNPYDAIVSEWNRQLSTKYRLSITKGVSHTASYGQEYFGNFKDWIRFVNIRIKKWSAGFDWILSCHGYHEILVIRYEDLKVDSFHQVKRMLDFLRYPYTDLQLHARLEEDFTAFQRSNKPQFDPYSQAEREVVAMEIDVVISKLKEGTSQTFGVEEYLPMTGQQQ